MPIIGSAQDLILVVGAVASAVIGIFVQARNSRCVDVSVLWGCIRCTRTITDDLSEAPDIEAQTVVPPSILPPPPLPQIVGVSTSTKQHRHHHHRERSTDTPPSAVLPSSNNYLTQK